MRVNPRASGVAANVGSGGHPIGTKKRREGPGDRKSTERRWPLPSFLAHGSVVGVKNEIAGWRG